MWNSIGLLNPPPQYREKKVGRKNRAKTFNATPRRELPGITGLSRENPWALLRRGGVEHSTEWSTPQPRSNTMPTVSQRSGSSYRRLRRYFRNAAEEGWS